jgi:hypothetical protein
MEGLKGPAISLAPQRIFSRSVTSSAPPTGSAAAVPRGQQGPDLRCDVSLAFRACLGKELDIEFDRPEL